MSEESKPADSEKESKSPNRSEQIAGLILTAIAAGGGLNALWAGFKEGDLPKALLSALFAGGVYYCTRLLQPMHKRAEEELDRMGNSVVKRGDSVASQVSGFEKKYLQALKIYCDELQIEGVRSYLKRVPLNEVFVPLQLGNDSTPVTYRRSKQIWDLLPKEGHPGDRVCRLAIIADPGYGKTTLTRYLTLSFSNETYREHHAQRLIPVLLLLRSLYPKIQDQRTPALPDLIADEVKQLPRCEDLRTSSQWFREQLQDGKCLVMLDGLDEVPEAQRENVSRWANWQMQHYPTPLILTSRPHGYDSTLFEQTQQIGIKDFNRDQKSDFIHKWYRADERDYWSSGRNSSDDRDQIEAQIEHRANERATELINQLALNSALNELANNPLLITIIAITYQASLVLPKHRAKLYQEIFKTLLELRPRRRDTKLTLSSAEKNQAVLQVLALSAMQQQKTIFTPQQGAQWIKVKLLEYSAELSPKTFLQEIQDIAGLLAGAESDIIASHFYQFTHKTFQEYLAAVEVYEHHSADFLIEQFHNSAWKEVVCFYAAMHNATRFVQIALENRTDYAMKLAHRMVADEGSKVDRETYDRLTQALEGADLSGVLGSKVQLEQRFRARIAILDDNRIISEVITVGEYHLFMQAQADEQFHSKAKKLPLSLSESCPVTDIYWQDARWFCAWLSTQASLQSDDVVYDYRLPTEAELQRITDRQSFTNSETSHSDRTLRVVRETLPNRYKSLHSYLANGRWQEADRETDNVMLEVARRKELGYLDIVSIQNFPCEDLRIIDRLWVTFSGGRFGFSVQKRIYVECGNLLDGQYHEGKWEAFCDRVAWRKNGNYVNYPSEVAFHTSAPQGHLPLNWRALGKILVEVWRRRVYHFSRAETCEL